MAVTLTRPPTSDRMFSVQDTQARSPPTIASMWESVKRISAVFSKILAHDSRTASQPLSSGQPGCTHLTWSPCAHTRSISPMSSVSKAR